MPDGDLVVSAVLERAQNVLSEVIHDGQLVASGQVGALGVRQHAVLHTFGPVSGRRSSNGDVRVAKVRLETGKAEIHACVHAHRRRESVRCSIAGKSKALEGSGAARVAADDAEEARALVECLAGGIVHSSAKLNLNKKMGKKGGKTYNCALADAFYDD